MALVKAKEQAQELRAQLRPLKEENQELKLKRACLEEKLKLIHIQRREDVQRYKVSAAAVGKTAKLKIGAQIDLDKDCTFQRYLVSSRRQSTISRNAPES